MQHLMVLKWQLAWTYRFQVHIIIDYKSKYSEDFARVALRDNLSHNLSGNISTTQTIGKK
jgi:hypothetical protein